VSCAREGHYKFEELRYLVDNLLAIYNRERMKTGNKSQYTLALDSSSDKTDNATEEEEEN